ncbi:MAG: hypothetical protein LBG76_05330 [Treponema sp.]|jgi:hypothetical protein|nr:hypothetical protein [Treponema sp.]
MIRYSFVHILAISFCLLGVFFTGCDAQSGDIFTYTGGNRAGVTSLIIIPVRREYSFEHNPVFDRRIDFTVLGVYPDGTARIFDPQLVTVSVDRGEPLLEDTYTFSSPGEYEIDVSYAGRIGYYTVWVLSENEGPSSGEKAGSVGIVIEIH